MLCCILGGVYRTFRMWYSCLALYEPGGVFVGDVLSLIDD